MGCGTSNLQGKRGAPRKNHKKPTPTKPPLATLPPPHSSGATAYAAIISASPRNPLAPRSSGTIEPDDSAR